MSTGTTCALYVDGERFADTGPDAARADPTALTGLTVAWGRDTTVDQPGPSTCSFTVADPAGGRSFLGLLHTGLPVDVTATGTEYPDPTVSTFLDPGFETDPIAATPQNATVGASPRVVHGGLRALQILPVDGTRRWTVTLPPAPFVPAGTSPGAWDTIPQTAPGQTWHVGAWVYAPAGRARDRAARPVRRAMVDRREGRRDRHDDRGPGCVGAGVRTASARGRRGVGRRRDLRVPHRAGMEGRHRHLGRPGPGITWQDVAAVYVDDVTVLAPAAGTTHEVLVFSGRITNVAAAWDDTIRGPAVNVTAADFTADLANRDVGDEPWPVEAMGERFNRIIALSEYPVTADIDPSIADVPVSWQDVDNQPTTGLLQALAQSVDGVMWPAVHQTTGAYLKVEDPSGRASLYRLEMVDGLVVVVQVGEGGTVLSACDVLRDPVEFTQDVSDITTRAAVSWLEQITDDQGLPGTAEHTVTVIDADLEATYGTRRISLTTQLTTSADAVDVANRLMARLTDGGWRGAGLVVDDGRLDQAAQTLTLLDGTSRIGLPVRVTDLPPWSPAGSVLPVYLEGGTYHYDDGRWVLDLSVSSARGQGQSVTWDETDPTWRWVDVDPALTWAGVYGVAGPDLLEVAA